MDINIVWIIKVRNIMLDDRYFSVLIKFTFPPVWRVVWRNKINQMLSANCSRTHVRVFAACSLLAHITIRGYKLDVDEDEHSTGVTAPDIDLCSLIYGYGNSMNYDVRFSVWKMFYISVIIFWKFWNLIHAVIAKNKNSPIFSTPSWIYFKYNYNKARTAVNGTDAKF